MSGAGFALRLTLAGAALLAGCFRAPEGNDFPANQWAKAQGIERYRILSAGPRDILVDLVGAPSGRLAALVRGDVVEQTLTAAGQQPLVLHTSSQRIELRRGGVTSLLAVQEGGTWTAVESPSTADVTQIRTIVAVDLDLAVQGASMIRDGSAYVFCTWECDRASACLSRTFTDCAERMATCAACLEQEP